MHQASIVATQESVLTPTEGPPCYDQDNTKTETGAHQSAAGLGSMPFEGYGGMIILGHVTGSSQDRYFNDDQHASNHRNMTGLHGTQAIGDGVEAGPSA